MSKPWSYACLSLSNSRRGQNLWELQQENWHPLADLSEHEKLWPRERSWKEPHRGVGPSVAISGSAHSCWSSVGRHDPPKTPAECLLPAECFAVHVPHTHMRFTGHTRLPLDLGEWVVPSSAFWWGFNSCDLAKLSIFFFFLRKSYIISIFLHPDQKPKVNKYHLNELVCEMSEDGRCFKMVSQFGHSVMSNSLQHARPPCPSPTPGDCSNSCPSSQWCHPTISSSVIPFSSCPQSFQASGSFPRSQFFTSDGQSIGVSASASVLPMNIQDWFPL